MPGHRLPWVHRGLLYLCGVIMLETGRGDTEGELRRQQQVAELYEFVERTRARADWLARIAGAWGIAGSLAVACVASTGRASILAVIAYGAGAMAFGIVARAHTRYATEARIARLERRGITAGPQEREPRGVWAFVCILLGLSMIASGVFFSSGLRLTIAGAAFSFAAAGLPYWFDWGVD